MSDKTVINNWTGGGTLQTWPDGEWQILYAKDSAGNCVTLSLTSQDAIRLAYAVSPIPSEQFDRMRAANEAVYELSYPETRAEELREIANEIDCGSGCEGCSPQKIDRGEFCGFVSAESLRKLAAALDLKASLSHQPAPVDANASAEARLREALVQIQTVCTDRHDEALQFVASVVSRALYPHASDCDKQKECCDLAAKEPCPDCPYPVAVCVSTKSEGGVEGHAIPRTTSATTTRYPATEGEEHMVAPARRTEEKSSTKTGQVGIKPGPSDRTADVTVENIALVLLDGLKAGKAPIQISRALFDAFKVGRR